VLSFCSGSDDASIYEKGIFVNKVVFEKEPGYICLGYRCVISVNTCQNCPRGYPVPTPIKSTLKGAAAAAQACAVPYVRFSDKLTASIGSLHILAVKYARTANTILDVLLPIRKNLPIMPKNVMQMLTDLEGITQKIIDNEASMTRAIADVRSGLRADDANKIRGHAVSCKLSPGP
jgi:hypothetical protein